MDGRIKFYDNYKKWGFITGSDGKDYFIHAKCFKDDIVLFSPGTQVTFTVEVNIKGPVAINVKKTGG